MDPMHRGSASPSGLSFFRALLGILVHPERHHVEATDRGQAVNDLEGEQLGFARRDFDGQVETSRLAFQLAAYEPQRALEALQGEPVLSVPVPVPRRGVSVARIFDSPRHGVPPHGYFDESSCALILSSDVASQCGKLSHVGVRKLNGFSNYSARSVKKLTAFAVGIALALAGCSGCSPNWLERTPERDEQALQLVWFDTYAMPSPAPAVDAHDAADCVDEVTRSSGIRSASGACVDGWTDLFDDGRAPVVHYFYYQRYSATALAHELLHARIGLTVPHSGGDPTHARPEWQTDVPAAERALAEAGL